MNPVLMLCRNALAQTQRAVASVEAQDVPTWLYVIDNGSSDGTEDWLSSDDYKGVWARYSPQLGVSAGWNRGLSYLFGEWGADHVLVLNNDLVLPPWFYREHLAYPGPFISGVAVEDLAEIAFPAQKMPLAASPGFSAYLMRRECWERVGRFDEAMALYASDCDYHVRAHRLGVPLMMANIPYYHERSSTLRLASAEDAAAIAQQADADRAVFRAKYGCVPGEPAYAELFR